MNNEREQLIARLLRFAVVLEARGERYDTETCELAIAALSAPPAGWVLVPREPTEAMKKAGGHANSEWLNDDAPIGESRYGGPVVASIWKDMLAAAPQPPAEPQERVLLCRSEPDGSWQSVTDAEAPVVREQGFEVRYATLDPAPKEGEQHG